MEGILNSRLLVLLSIDPSELNALTPGHFLTGQGLVTLSEENLPKEISTKSIKTLVTDSSLNSKAIETTKSQMSYAY